MSGIEVAGLVLGAIPLVISGLEHYGECAQFIKSIRDYPKEFATMSRRLRMEQATFRNTMELILSSCVRGRSLEQMLADPAGQSWEEADMEQELQHILQTSYSVFIETVISMSEALTDFMGRLRLGPDGKGPFHDSKSFKEAYKRFRFALKKSDYMGLIEVISKDNASLCRLAQMSSMLAPTRTRRRRPVMDLVRTNATNVFASLQKALLFSRQSSHMASLYINHKSQQRHDPKSAEENESENFRIVLQHTPTAGHPVQWHCNETEIRLSGVTPQSSGAKLTKTVVLSRVRFADPNDKAVKCPTNSSGTASNTLNPAVIVPDIQDLCGNIVSLQSRECGVCLGYLANALPSTRLGLFRPQIPIVNQDSFGTMSLRDILGRKQGAPHLSVANRQRLATSLAIVLLRLHGTPWLDKQWGHREITFFSNGGRVLVEHPFLSTKLDTPSTNRSPAVYFTSSAAIRNESLFALGILLIELCLHRPFEDLLLPADLNADGTKHATTEYCAALRLLDTITGEASLEYVEVTRQCIECQFNQGAASLDNEIFRDAVYDNVVTVLEEEASRFARP